MKFIKIVASLCFLAYSVLLLLNIVDSSDSTTFLLSLIIGIFVYKVELNIKTPFGDIKAK